jgi:hypothetical protein
MGTDTYLFPCLSRSPGKSQARHSAAPVGRQGGGADLGGDYGRGSKLGHPSTGSV